MVLCVVQVRLAIVVVPEKMGTGTGRPLRRAGTNLVGRECCVSLAPRATGAATGRNGVGRDLVFTAKSSYYDIVLYCFDYVYSSH